MATDWICGTNDDDEGEGDFDWEAPVELAIDGVLDLHHFAPREVPSLVADYLDACRQKGIDRVRIIHGKGAGTLRKTVRAIAMRHPFVIDIETADATQGGWGATLLTLRLD